MFSRSSLVFAITSLLAANAAFGACRQLTFDQDNVLPSAQGFTYVGQTVYNSTFGGKEVVVILESSDQRKITYEYRLQATSRTSTMEKELNVAGRDGYQFCGVTVAETAFGGKEVVSILRRAVEQK